MGRDQLVVEHEADHWGGLKREGEGGEKGDGGKGGGAPKVIMLSS